METHQKNIQINVSKRPSDDGPSLYVFAEKKKKV